MFSSRLKSDNILVVELTRKEESVCTFELLEELFAKRMISMILNEKNNFGYSEMK